MGFWQSVWFWMAKPVSEFFFGLALIAVMVLGVFAWAYGMALWETIKEKRKRHSGSVD